MKVILALLLILIVSVTLISCTDNHTHAYGDWTVKTESRCEKVGMREKRCSCGDIVTEEIPSLGHNFVGGICTDCGETE